MFTMNRLCFRLNLIALIAIVAFSLFTLSHGIAQEATSALSGRVVGVDGHPIAGFPIAIQPFKVVDGVRRRGNDPLLESQTDDAGHFSILNIVPSAVQLVTSPYHAPEYEILSIKIGLAIAYQNKISHPGGITFAIKPGAHLENVEVKVKLRMRMRGQIVFPDGTPLASQTVEIKAHYYEIDGTGYGSSSSSAGTDDEGYFIEYVDKSGLYTVTVNYQGLSATAKPFLIQDGERKDDVIFTFEDKPIPTKSPFDRVEVSAGASTSPLPGVGEWVVNPANGHTYKRIHCKSWDDANIQAVAEDAHLVSINDAAEQRWLSGTFGYSPYWIGLTDFAEEGEWSWTSGEPVTYTNWAPHEPMDADRGEEDYVIMCREWSDVGTESAEWQSTRMAIIERNNSSGKTPMKE